MSAHSPFAAPIRISANQRYLVDADNPPFFWLGDTAWLLFIGCSRVEVAWFSTPDFWEDAVLILDGMD